MPTTTAPPVRGMVAVSKNAQIKPLGYVIWFSVPDENVSLRRLRRVWQLAGLDPTPLPTDQRAVNAFKRAVREQEKVGTFTDRTTGLRVETDVRDVVEDGDAVIYQVSRVVRHPDDRTVEYPKAIRVWFNKQTGDIDFTPLDGISRKEVLPIMESITELFDANSKSVTGAKVRTLVRSYIKNDSDEAAGLVGLSGENMRGKAGGVYFVLAKYADQLESLAEFLDELYEGGRAYLYRIPMVDGKTEREMIRARHVANCLDEMKEAMADTAELLREGRSREIRSNVKSHHWNRLQRFRRHAAEYAEALQDEQAELNDGLEMLRAQLDKLI